MNFQQLTEKLIVFFFHVIGLVPEKGARTCAVVLGRLWFAADRKRREITLDNILGAYPEMEKETAVVLSKKVFQNLALIPFEIGRMLGVSPKEFQNRVSITGAMHFHNALKKGKGVLVLTGHMGNWELLPWVAAIMGFSPDMVYRPLDFRPLDLFFTRNRTRFGGNMIRSARAMRRILRSLQKGRPVAILLDQSVDWYEGVYVDFFGRITCTNKGMAQLAMVTDAPVVPFFLVRENNRYRAVILPEIPKIRTGDRTKDTQENTLLYNRAIESVIRKYPDQWFWVHRRWKKRPFSPWPGEANPETGR